MVAGGPVLWETKRQDIIALSTVEAQFMVFSQATTQALWISKYFDEIKLPVVKPILIYADNNGAISNSTNNKNYCRTKYIDVRHHFIKEWVSANKVNFLYIPSSENLTDFLTKPLSRDALHRTITLLDLNPKSRVQQSRGSIEQDCNIRRL